MKILFWFIVVVIPSNCLSQVIYNEPRSRLIDRQTARSMYLDNRLKSVETFWAIQDIYAARQEMRFAKIDQRRDFYLSRHGLTYLDENEYDGSSGTIMWTYPLNQARYFQYRNVYDRLVKKNAYEGGLDFEEYREIKETSIKWRLLLASQRNVYPSNLASDMIRFILKIDREIQ